MTIDELIARLETASEGSRELDAFVLAALVRGEARYVERIGKWLVYRGANRHGQPELWQPSRGIELEWWRRAYSDSGGPTRSLDAALMLASDGWAYQFCAPPLYGYKLPVASLYPPGKRWHTDRSLICEGLAATPALALCIAALKARLRVAPEPPEAA